MSDTRLAELGTKISAAMAKHGISERDILVIRRERKFREAVARIGFAKDQLETAARAMFQASRAFERFSELAGRSVSQVG